jgi:quercetin dioxygenase-like cupin family protein
MTTWSSKIACALFAIAAASAAHARPPEEGKPAAGKPAAGKAEAVFVKAKDLAWGEAPPDLPKGAQLAVLFGDPHKSGPFAVRLKMPDGYVIPPHWHTRDEQLTIVSGTLVMRMGDTKTAEAHELAAGDFHFLPGKMRHAAEAKGETVVQINGAGPFDIHYVNRADNPNPKTARK